MPSRRSSLQALVGAASLLLLLVGCGSGSNDPVVPPVQPPPPVAPPIVTPPATPVVATSRFAYAANQLDGTVSIYAVDARSGQLRANGYVVAGSAGGVALLDELRPVVVDSTNTFVYALVGSGADAAVFAGRINPESGGLMPVSGSPFGTQATAIAIDPAGRFFYTANRLPDRVSAYSIDPVTGALVEISTVLVGANPVSVIVDPTGKFVYVTNEGSNNVSAFGIDNATGSLAPIAGAPFATAISPRSMAINKSGTFAFIVSGDTSLNGTLSTYSIDAATGVLALTASVPAVDRFPWHATTNPSGTFLYVANGITSTVSAYSISPGGTLTEVAGSPYATGRSALSVTVDPSGSFVFVSTGDSASNDIVGFSADAVSGALSLLPAAPLTAARESPRGLAIAASGNAVEFKAQFAYAGNFQSNSLSGYSVDPTTGSLTVVPGAPFLTGTGPASVAIDPLNRYVYVANIGTKNISAFAIASASGSLTPIEGSPFAHPPFDFLGFMFTPDIQAVAVDASGRFLYAASAETSVLDSGRTLAFHIDQATGALTPVAGSPFSNGLTVPTASEGPLTAGRIAVDPRGKIVYVSYGNSPYISALRINPVTGALTSVPKTPFLGAGGPASLSFHPTGKFLYVANSGAFANSIYEIDATVTVDPSPPFIIRVDTGSLEPLPFGTFVTNAITSSVAVEATGRFAYALDPGADVIRGFSVDRRTGVTTAFAGSPMATGGTHGFAMTTDISGKFVYVANRTSNNISAFTINATDGALTVVPGSPFAAGGSPLSIAVSGSVQ